MIEAHLEIAHILFGRDIHEVEHRLHVAIEGLLVLHEALACAAESATQLVVAHHLIEERRHPFFAHLAELRDQVFGVALCHRSKYILESPSIMQTVATILAYASGFALMGYRESPAGLIATSLAVDASLAPLTA